MRWWSYLDKNILILGNMANDGYNIAKPLYDMGVNVTLGVNNADFGMSAPEWETEEFDEHVDPYDLNRKQMIKKEPPEWIKEFNFTMNLTFRPRVLLSRLIESAKILKMINAYDFAEIQVPFSIISRYARIPHVAYDGGWIRHFEDRRNRVDRWGEAGYNKADGVILTNPDTFRIAETLPTFKPKRLDFSPFAIPTDHYRKVDVEIPFIDKDFFNVFLPSRHVWNIKGNDRLFKAFARLVQHHPKSKLYTVAWSDDFQRSLHLVKSLGILDNVCWLPPMPKPTLIKMYSAVDVVADQFILGSWGTLTPEAWACEAPVLIYYNEDRIKQCFGELPPTPSVQSEDDIFNYLVTLLDKTTRLDHGRKNREWVSKTHDPVKVAKLHLNIWKEILE